MEGEVVGTRLEGGEAYDRQFQEQRMTSLFGMRRMWRSPATVTLVTVDKTRPVLTAHLDILGLSQSSVQVYTWHIHYGCKSMQC